MMTFQSYKITWVILFLSMASTVWADDVEMQRLFLTPQQRADIDHNRAIYLKYPMKTPEDRSRFDALNLPNPKVKKTSPSNPTGPVTITAVIRLPNGEQLVRINQKFYKRSSSQGSATEAEVSVRGEQVLVPVGESYLPDKKRWLKNYQLDKKGGQIDIKVHSPMDSSASK